MKKVFVLIILLLTAAVLTGCGGWGDVYDPGLPTGWTFDSTWELKALGVLSEAYPDDLQILSADPFYGSVDSYEYCLDNCADIIIPWIEETGDMVLEELTFDERDGVFFDGIAQYAVGNFIFQFRLDFDSEHTTSRSAFQTQYQEQDKVYGLEAEDRVIYIWPSEHAGPNRPRFRGALWLENAEIELGIYSTREEISSEEADLSVLEDFRFLTVEEIRTLHQGALFTVVCLEGSPEQIQQEFFWEDPEYFTCETTDSGELAPEMLQASVPCPPETENFSLEWLCRIQELDCYAVCYNIEGLRYLFLVQTDPEEGAPNYMRVDFIRRHPGYTQYTTQETGNYVYICGNEEAAFPEYLYTGLLFSTDRLATVKILRDPDGALTDADPESLKNFDFLPVGDILQMCSSMGSDPCPA